MVPVMVKSMDNSSNRDMATGLQRSSELVKEELNLVVRNSGILGPDQIIKDLAD